MTAPVSAFDYSVRNHVPPTPGIDRGAFPRRPGRILHVTLKFRKLLHAMIVLGIILLIAGFLLKISILWTIGIIVLIVGVVLTVMGSMGHAVAGRRTYY
jgi:hypothetical protein